MTVAVIVFIILIIRDRYIQKNGDSYYRNVYLPRKQLEEQQNRNK